MKFVKKISLLAIMVSAVFSLSIQAQTDNAERVGAMIGTRSEKPKDEAVVISKSSVALSDLADSNSYTFATTTTGSLTDMTSGTTQLLAGNIDDTASVLTNIGFDFYYMGARYTQFSINDNGVLRLGATAQTSTPYKPLAQAANPIITAYGADQRTHTTGSVRYKLTGAAPNRVLTVEWFNNQSNFNSGGTADLTYQIRLYESTGVIEFVYGSMTMSTLGAADTNSRDPHIGYSSSNVANTVGSVTAPQAGAPTFNGTSNDPTENLYTAGAITVLSGAVDGSRRTMTHTPPTPTAPTALNFTGVTAVSITVNWTDSANEDLYGIYRSTDGINYTFLATAAENAASHVDSTVFPGTTYFYRVFAVSEGALSTALAGSQATSPAGSDTCNGAGGLWNTPATWTDGSVPTAADNVTIGAGCTVTIDTGASAFSLTIQSGGILEFEAGSARILTVTDDVTNNAGGTFRSNAAGTQVGHVVSVGGDMVNNGTIDFSTNADTAGAGITFTGTANTSFTLGGASTTDLKQAAGVVVNKGTNNTPVLSFIPGGTLTVQGANTLGFMQITNGTFKMDGTGAFSNPLFNAFAYTIPATGGIWMNNPNATVVGQNASPTLAGRLQMTSGTFNIGTASGNSMGFSAGANLLIEGGAINATGRFGVAASGNAITYNQTAGTITTCTIGNASTTLACYDLGTGVGTTNITGGTIVIQNASTAASGPRDYRNQSGLTGTTTVTGATVQFGNASTTAAIQAFDVAGVFPNVVVDNTTAAHTVTFLAPAVFNNVTRNVLVNPGTTFNVGNNVFLFNGTTFTNNGTLTGNGASTNFVIFLTGAAVLYTGSGNVTVPLTNLAIQADGGSFTLAAASSGINANAVRLFSGNIINANELTIGSGAATTATVQIGNTTTPTNAGTFDSTPTFNPGTGGIVFSYLRSGSTATRNIGPEIPASRTITTLTHDNNFAGHVLTLTGGNLTVTGTMTQTNGIIGTSAANTLIHNGTTATRTGTCAVTTCFVDGPLRREYPAATGTTYTFHVGEGVYSPVGLANIVVAGSSELAAEAFNATLSPFPAATSISRNWGLVKTGVGGLVADVTFTYDQTDDVNGNEADYRLFRRDTAATSEVCGIACVDETTNVATAVGLSSFSRWTVSEAFAPTSINVDIGGRVLQADNLTGISKTRVTISGGNLPQPRTALTNAFGYFNFQGLQVGQTYVISVDSKQYTYTVPATTVTPVDNISNIVFIADPIQ